MQALTSRMVQASVFLLALPTAASAAERPLRPIHIFGDSAPLQKLIILFLAGSIVATGVIVARALTSRRPSSGSAFVSGLKTGGPLVGLLGALYSFMNGAIGVANIPITPTARIIAPGVAESLFVLGLGVLAGAVAAFAHAFIEARSARQWPNPISAHPRGSGDPGVFADAAH